MHYTCIIYYALEFDLVRRKCGISEQFVQSLQRCEDEYTLGSARLLIDRPEIHNKENASRMEQQPQATLY